MYRMSDAQCHCSPPGDECPACPQAAVAAPWPAPPAHVLSTTSRYGISLWPVRVHCHCCAQSQPRMYLPTGKTWEAEMALTVIIA